MRPRTFILLIIVVLLIALAAVLFFLNRSGGSVADVLPGGADTDVTAGTPAGEPIDGSEPGIPIPTPTPEPAQFVPVVVSKIRLSVGDFITEDLLKVEERPITNIALQGGYTFTDTEKVAGHIARVDIARGQEILAPMLAMNPTDTASFGSDLALHIPRGEVAVAFPITATNGVALAMRPGDTVDVMMSLRTIEIDPEFRSPLPNTLQLVSESALLEGREFLFPAIPEGRLEFITELNQVALIVPSTPPALLRPGGGPLPKRVTQLSIQNAEVLWMGRWVDPRKIEQDDEAAQAAVAATAQANELPVPTPTPLPERFEREPNMVILSLTSQEALTLKWAEDLLIDIDLALRSPGDNTVFVTTSVSLSQMIDQGLLSIPEPMNFDLYYSQEIEFLLSALSSGSSSGGE